MGVQPAARAVVEEIVGTQGDATVLNYVISVLDDEDFDFGPEGREAYEAFGEMLVLSLLTYSPPTAVVCWHKLLGPRELPHVGGRGMTSGTISSTAASQTWCCFQNVGCLS